MSKAHIIRLILCICLGISLCYVSSSLVGRHNHFFESINNQFAILEGRSTTFGGKEQYFGAWQNRVMFPLILSALAKWGGLSLSQWYIALRIVSAVSALYVFAWALNAERPIGWRLEAAGLGTLTLTLLMCFTTPWENPSDFFDVAFISVFLWATLQRRRWSLLLLAIIAASNRESASFAGIIWAAAQGFSKEQRPIWHEIAYGAAVSLAVFSVVMSLRYGFGGLKAVGSETQTFVGLWGIRFRLSQFLDHPTPYSWPFLLFIAIAPASLWILTNRQFLDEIYARLLLAAILIFVGSLAFTHISEIRPFIPAFVIMIFVAVGCEGRRLKTRLMVT